MPWIWAEPETLIELAEGTVICHCYKGDMCLSYHYQFADPGSDTGWTAFDIRDVGCKSHTHDEHARYLNLLGRQARRTSSTFQQYLVRRRVALYDGEYE